MNTTTSRATTRRAPFGFMNLRTSMIAVATVIACAGCGGGDTTTPSGSNPATETFAASLGVNIAAMTKISDDLYTQDQVVGGGPLVSNNNPVTVIYTGWLANGTQFDSNVGGTPLTFTLGVKQVITGWDEGIIGMHVGGKRLLVIGSALAYGAAGRGSIPPNSTLVFTVQVTAAQ